MGIILGERKQDAQVKKEDVKVVENTAVTVESKQDAQVELPRRSRKTSKKQEYGQS